MTEKPDKTIGEEEREKIRQKGGKMKLTKGVGTSSFHRVSPDA